MSLPTVSQNHPDNRNKLLRSDTTENTLQLNKITLNQKGISALDTEGQRPQGCNVYILSPAQLNDIGLVTKMSNGRPVIMHESKDGSTAEVVSSSQLVPLLQTQKISPSTVIPDRMNATNSGACQEVAGISGKSRSLRGPQCVKMSEGVKRKRLEENDGNLQDGLYKVSFWTVWIVPQSVYLQHMKIV
jgi:hypothetical protein